MVDCGADKCVPCKMMAPILIELRRDYRGKVEVEFVDVWKNPDVGRKAGIRVISTQKFYDCYGKKVIHIDSNPETDYKISVHSVIVFRIL